MISPAAATIPDRGAPDPREAGEARRWLAARQDGGRCTAAMLVALTRFDIVNAAYGRAAGDALLAAALNRIEAAARDPQVSAALVERVGGAAFVLVMEVPAERVRGVAGQVADALAAPFPVGASRAVLGSLIGVAVAEPGDDAAGMIRRAGDALAGTGAGAAASIRYAAPVGAAPIEDLAVDLHRAMERGEIDVLFQPQVAIADDRITGVEALARWEHPSLGVLGAAPLFSAAARAGLGLALSDHIQALALSRAAAWSGAMATLRVSINLTAADLARPGFADLFLARVATSGLDPARLTVELTEEALVDDLPGAAALLDRLRGQGMRVALDDFGTGYSGLAYLSALPLDYLKLDKRLSQDITGDARDQVIVRGVLAIARGLELAVIAEGVETMEQRDLLAAENCANFQGFLCAGPLTEAALAALLAGAG